jgi:hypothetical protein
MLKKQLMKFLGKKADEVSYENAKQWIIYGLHWKWKIREMLVVFAY